MASKKHIESRSMFSQIHANIHQISHWLEQIQQYRRQQANLLLIKSDFPFEVLL